jgi:hypothetical protein
MRVSGFRKYAGIYCRRGAIMARNGYGLGFTIRAGRG